MKFVSNTFNLKRLEYYFFSAVIFLCLFLMVYMLWPIIYLPFKNPDELSGPLTKIEFNPMINYLRYIMVVVILPIVFITFQSYLKRFGPTIIRYLLIVVIASSLFFSYSTDYLRHYASIDMFHVGERISPGSAAYFFDQKPFSDIFFLHGAFTDYYSSLISFKLFQPTIGSFLFLNYCLNLVAFVLFLYLLHTSIKNQYIFLTATVIFFGSLPLLDIYRDFFVILYLLVLSKYQQHRLGLTQASIFSTAIAFASLFHSIDRGIYLLGLNSILVVLAYALISGKTLRARLLSYLKKVVAPVGATMLILISLSIAMLGLKSFGNFISVSFIQIPKMSSLMFDYEYPAFSWKNLGIYWLPIILLITNGLFVFNYLVSARKSIRNKPILVIASYILSVLFYRSALGRSDLGHVSYAFPSILLTTFLILDYQLLHSKKIIFKSLLIVISALLIFTPFFSLTQTIPWRKYSWYDLKIFFSLPSINDDYWLTEETKMVRDKIEQDTAPDEYVFVFSNEVLYYHLLERMSPTKYYIAWFAEPKKSQEEVIHDLTERKPAYIIYKSALWTNEIDGIPNTERLAKINAWIVENYSKSETIGNTTLLTY